MQIMPREGPARPSLLVRQASRLVKAYLTHSPTSRGKWWLRRHSARFLVTRLDSGPWIRVSGVSDFEWQAFQGRPLKEDRTLAFFLSRLESGQVVIDVGANIGYYTLAAAVRVGQSGHVYSFEPGADSAARLRENVRLNGLSNVTVLEAAVADHSGTAALVLATESEGHSLYEVSASGVGHSSVSVTTLDEAVGNDRTVDLVKLDAEGAEVAILRGARTLLTGRHRPVVIVESNPVTLRAAGESPATLKEQLTSLGYSTTVLEGVTWRGELTEYWAALPNE